MIPFLLFVSIQVKAIMVTFTRFVFVCFALFCTFFKANSLVFHCRENISMLHAQSNRSFSTTKSTSNTLSEKFGSFFIFAKDFQTKKKKRFFLNLVFLFLAFWGISITISLFLKVFHILLSSRRSLFASQMRHPFILQFLGVCEHGADIFIVTEYLSSGDVTSLLEKEGDIPWSLRLSIMTQLCQAMIYLHSKSIIHRDLKAKKITFFVFFFSLKKFPIISNKTPCSLTIF